ncbi:MAG: transglycosylase domain-containing protein [Proteobacteria bacterium]|nr:transglycosylase domain-containing protein [Pseudomonadota bacterium]
MNKKIVRIVVVAVSIVLLFCLVGVGVRHWAMLKVGEKMQNRIEDLGWTVEVEPAPFWRAPLCYDRFALKSPKDSHLTFHELCLNDGLLSLFGKAYLMVSTREIDGWVDWEAFEQLSALHEKQKTFLEKEAKKQLGLMARLLEASVSYNVELIKIKFGVPGAWITLRSENADFWLNEGKFGAKFSFQPTCDIAKALFAIASLPVVSLKLNVDLEVLRRAIKKENGADEKGEPWARLEVSSEPTFDLSFAWHDEPVEIKVAGLDAEIAGNDLVSVGLKDVAVSMPDSETLGNASIHRLAVAFHGMPVLGSFDAIRLIEPHVQVKIDEVLASEKVMKHAVLGSLVRFWQKDAGSIFGEAPKLSVRREDVKKPKPKIKTNPIPKETLEGIRLAFNQFQKTIMALPAIDIQNGRIEIMHATDVFAFDAVSFNTAELFKDDQKFRLEFNMRDAKASFEVNYEDDSPFPELELGVTRLRAPEFLALLNMPVPEKSDGTVSAKLNLSMDEHAFQLSGNMVFDHFAFFHEKISPNVIQDMNASMDLQVVYNFENDKITISPLSLTSGPVTVSGFFNVTNVRSDPVIEFELGAKDIPCEDIPAAIPNGFLPTITDLQITGTQFSPKLTGKIPWKNPLVSSLKESGFEGKCFPISVAPHNPSLLNDPEYVFTTDYTYFVDHITVGPGSKTFTPLNRIPPYVRAAMLLTEDKRFFDHGPLRISFIERGLRLNLNQRKYVYGGSTISQQLAKNLFLDRRKNLARKLEEAFVAWRMENVVSKSRILELYINMIEFGPDVYGITQAAKFYFDKTPEQLTPLEGAYLASLKVSPSKGGRFYKSGFPSSGWWPKRMKYILKVLAENGYISPAEVLAAYPWIPQFVYPEPTDIHDARNVWLRNYTEYLLEQSRQKKREEADARQAASDK